MSWTLKAFDNERAELLMKEFGLSRTTAVLLARRQTASLKTVKRFLQPRLSQLASPFSIPGVEKAVQRLIQAIQKQERVFVLGDYDVDGVTSTALFVNVMRELGLEPHHSVPKRSDDGVGLSLGLVQSRLLHDKADFDLVVTLDCGSNDRESIEALREHGLDVLIIDHHQVRSTVHPEAIIVNPHLYPDEAQEAIMLCTVALTFKLMQALLMRLRSSGHTAADALSLKDQLDLVALGTVTDLVPLTGENRVLVSHGLHRMSKSKNMGLQALMDVCGLPYGQDLDVSDVSFKIGPRINAGGRMADATTSVNLLTCQQYSACVKFAHELDSLNQDRQSTEREMHEQAISYLSRKSPHESVVLYDSQWHSGVVGIVASRIARQFGVPTVVLGLEGDLARGSARSIEGVNIIDALAQCEDYLESWGGHPMAAGLSVRPENLDVFRRTFSKAITVQVDPSGEQCQPVEPMSVEVDAWVQAADLTLPFMAELRRLGPFGVGNPDPVLAMRGAQLASRVSRFGADNFKCWVSLWGMDYDLMCLGWGFPSRIPESRYPLDILFHLKWHEWKGRGYPQATLIDWRYSL
ncbi:MAG: single-stranded-DNA-specific exonuclease RecJ [Puniceicoccaceae bacterium]